MKVLVTGAAGFIGSHTAERLNALGYHVTGIDCFSDYYDVSIKKVTEVELLQQGIKIITADLADPGCFDLLPADFNYIFHLAAQPGISTHVPFNNYVTNNFIATQNLLQFALRNKHLRMFVNISTSSVYGLDATQAENFPAQPASYYGVTKLAAEQLVLSYVRMQLLQGCSLRLYSVYGPRERPDKLYTKLICATLLDKEFTLFVGSENHVRSFTYVDDIVGGITGVTGKEEICNGEVFNLGSEEEHTTRYGMECVEALLEKKVHIIAMPGRPGDQLRTKANIDKARKLLHYTPHTSLKQGLRVQVEWCEKYLHLLQ